MKMDDRPQPEELLRKYDLKEKSAGGSLRIFFGYAAGVGKTYAMLEAAHRAQKAGADVVAGYIEPHTRPETLALLDGLERLSPLEIKYKGLTLREFDIDAALRRKPGLILVDELAHTNAEGCRHEKRYQDVEELLRAGIDVYTTVNVQHLESLNDAVAAITGTSVQERVPDRVFDRAQQVEVIDLEPDELIERLREGKIYRNEQAERALTAFFSKKNLAALRETALRRTAERLSRTARATWEKSGTGEHILTCLSASPSNAKVIRTAARMSAAFGGAFTALFVETTANAKLSAESAKKLHANVKLAEELGAVITTVYGENIAKQIADYALACGATKIVLGKTNHRRSLFSINRNLLDSLAALAPDLEVYIIPDKRPLYRPGLKQRLDWEGTELRTAALDLGKATALLALATAAGALIYKAGLSESNIIIVYLLSVLLTALCTGSRLAGIYASLISVLTFNFFFTEPRYTLEAYGAGYPLTFAMMLTASFIATSLVLTIKRQGSLAAQKACTTEVLLETNHRLQKAQSSKEIISCLAEQLEKLLHKPIVFYTAEAAGRAGSPCSLKKPENPFPPEAISEQEKAVAQWVLKNNREAGATTSTLPGSECLYLAVRGQKAVYAAAGIWLGKEPEHLEPALRNLLFAVLGEGGLALEREALEKEKKEIEINAKQQQLRADLLRAISHDLRTPLTAISGSAAILLQNPEALGKEKQKELCSAIYDDSVWLINLVENLLSVTRIEGGKMKLSLEPELLEEVFAEAESHLDRHVAEHTLKTEISDELLMAQLDARLIVQVIINLLNNAVKYTPKGSQITLSAEKTGELARVTVADDGPGIPEAAKKQLFEMFYTAGGASSDSRRGLGLGLSLCRSIIEAHGGKIWVENNEPQGTKFIFTLKAVEVRENEQPADTGN